MRRSSLIISVLALFVALGGSAFAAATYINGSQIAPHSIPKNRLTGSAIASLHGLKGARGYPGPQGPQGVQGVQGAPGVQAISRQDGSFNVNAGEINTYTVSCPAGMGIISGGGYTSAGEIFINKNYGGTSWSIGVDNFFGSVGGPGDVVANCSPGVTVSSLSSAVLQQKLSDAVTARRAADARVAH